MFEGVTESGPQVEDMYETILKKFGAAGGVSLEANSS